MESFHTEHIIVCRSPPIDVYYFMAHATRNEEVKYICRNPGRTIYEL